MKILVISGANLNMLGSREAGHYGTLTLEKLQEKLVSEYPSHQFTFYQSSIEGEIVQRIHQAAREDCEGLIINPGGYAHTSVVIRDALDLLSIPKIEVHLSNLSSRESFRQNLITASACDGYISGLKEFSYLAAVSVLDKIKQRS